jgi:molybdopterin converting factor small subunit
VDSDNPTANRMHFEGAHNATPVVQEIVDEVAEEQTGAEVEQVEAAIQDKWADTFGEAAAPVPDEDAAEMAQHISDGTEVKIVPPAIPASPTD